MNTFDILDCMADGSELTVNLAADFDDPGGYGRHARNFAAALNRLVRVIPLYYQRPADCQPDDTIMPQLGRWVDLGPGISLAPLRHLRAVPGSTRIFYTVWETSRVPGPYIEFLANADQVWVPTAWGRDIFQRSGLDSARIRVVPEGVNAARFRPRPRTRPRDVFRLLCVGKWEERKGIAQLVRTFCREFRPMEPVELVIHGCNPYLPNVDVRKLVVEECRRTGREDARIVLSDPLPLDHFIALMQDCDAFVLPTRAEAWGLPILEAMACGLPCIVTDYGGPRTFANHSNSFLIAVASMCSATDPDHFPDHTDWGEWAEPDLNHLAHLMRYVFENREEARAKGVIARRHAVQRWSWDNAARIAVEHLRSLSS